MEISTWLSMIVYFEATQTDKLDKRFRKECQLGEIAIQFYYRMTETILTAEIPAFLN